MNSVNKNLLESVRVFLQLANVRQVAKACMLSYPTVLNIKNEKNKTPNWRTLNKLAKYYNII